MVAQFDPPGHPRRGAADRGAAEPLIAHRRAARVSSRSPRRTGRHPPDGASFAVHLPARIAIVGPPAAARRSSLLVARQPVDPERRPHPDRRPERAQASGGDTGRQITYVGYPRADLRRHDRRQPVLRSEAPSGAAARLEDADAEASSAERSRRRARATSPFDTEADWIDYQARGPDGPDESWRAAVRALVMVRPRSRRLPDGPARHDRSRGAAGGRRRCPRGARRGARAARRSRASAAWSRCSTRAATTPTRRSPRTSCSARRSARRSTSTHLAAHPYVQRILERRPDGAPSSRSAQARRDHGRAVRRSAARSRVFPPVQLHHADDLPDYRALPTGRSKPAGHARVPTIASG